MPAIITHDFFGRDVYNDMYKLIGGSKDEADAFLLGNQGPDPLFFSFLDPAMRGHTRLGNTMHAKRPSQLIAALNRAVAALPAEELPVGRAYALGFLCHYTLDSTMHPFIYFQQYSLCDAGEPGLDREDGSEVHAVIESELDELVLYAKRGETVATYNPSREILHASDEVLRIASKLHSFMAWEVYGEDVPDNLFAASVNCLRFAQGADWSPHGIKRQIVGDLECLVRRHSYIRAWTPRPVALEESQFDNHECRPWQNPYTGEVRSVGFWGLYDQALAQAKKNILAFKQPGFDLEAARKITADLNFSGKPTEASIVEVQSAEEAAATVAAAAAAREDGDDAGAID